MSSPNVTNSQDSRVKVFLAVEMASEIISQIPPDPENFDAGIKRFASHWFKSNKDISRLNVRDLKTELLHSKHPLATNISELFSSQLYREIDSREEMAKLAYKMNLTSSERLEYDTQEAMNEIMNRNT